MVRIAHFDTIGDMLDQIPELSTFNQLVRRSGVIVDLDGEGPFTVFAPTNEAFDKLPPNALGNIVKVPADLERFVRHHVAPGSFDRERIIASDVVPTVLGVGLEVIDAEPGPYVGGARVVDADIGTGNGVVHTVDDVIGPE